MYPSTGEAVITYVNAPSRSRIDAADKPVPVLSSEEQQDRLRRSKQRSIKRARTRSRRYAVHNKLHILWTLTYRPGSPGLHSRSLCKKDAATFVKELQRKLGRFPFFYVAERHPDGHGWHIHLLIGRWVSWPVVAGIWHQGQVDVVDLALEHRRSGMTMNQAVKQAASRGSMYCAKQWSDEDRPRADHLYEVGQGFAPKPIEGEASTLADALTTVFGFFGHRQPDSVWDSNQAEHWDGPPVFVLRWDTPNFRTRVAVAGRDPT